MTRGGYDTAASASVRQCHLTIASGPLSVAMREATCDYEACEE